MVGLSQTEPYHRRQGKSNTIGRQPWGNDEQCYPCWMAVTFQRYSGWFMTQV